MFPGVYTVRQVNCASMCQCASNVHVYINTEPLELYFVTVLAMFQKASPDIPRLLDY